MKHNRVGKTYKKHNTATTSIHRKQQNIISIYMYIYQISKQKKRTKQRINTNNEQIREM